MFQKKVAIFNHVALWKTYYKEFILFFDVENEMKWYNIAEIKMWKSESKLCGFCNCNDIVEISLRKMNTEIWKHTYRLCIIKIIRYYKSFNVN